MVDGISLRASFKMKWNNYLETASLSEIQSSKSDHLDTITDLDLLSLARGPCPFNLFQSDRHRLNALGDIAVT